MTPNETIERVWCEFVAREFESSGFETYGDCDTCGGPQGIAFTLEDIRKILDGLKDKL